MWDCFSRPVLRNVEMSVVFTRINPADRGTSVIVRMRPGWEELRAHIMGVDIRR